MHVSIVHPLAINPYRCLLSIRYLSIHTAAYCPPTIYQAIQLSIVHPLSINPYSRLLSTRYLLIRTAVYTDTLCVASTCVCNEHI